MTFLIDTNLLVYPFDACDPVKRRRAREVLRVLIERRVGRLSSQALAEFAHVMLRKLGVPAGRVHRLVDRYRRLFPVYPVAPAVVLEVVRGVQACCFAYFLRSILHTVYCWQLQLSMASRPDRLGCRGRRSL